MQLHLEPGAQIELTDTPASITRARGSVTERRFGQDGTVVLSLELYPRVGEPRS